MLRTLKLLALTIFGIIAASPVYAGNQAAAKVNGVPIPQERVDMRVKVVTAQGNPDSPELRKAIREDLVNIELMAQEAHKKGLDKVAETVQKIEFQKQSVLINVLVQDYLKAHLVTAQDIKNEYAKLKNPATAQKEYRVRHILVKKESAAKTIAKKLKKGGKKVNFESLAKANSTDNESKKHGGDLGWFPVANINTAFVKPFVDALMKLHKGEVSEPVQSKFGWHIIKLDDVRDTPVPPLDKIKAQITKHLQQQLVMNMITELRSKAKIE